MRNTFTVILCLSLVHAAGAQELPEDLKQVPGNAAGFVHFRTADLWKSPAFKMYRDLLPKAGADAVKMLEERISPPLSSIDRATLVAFPTPNRGRPSIGIIIHTAIPFNKQKLVANLPKLANDRDEYVTPKNDVIMIFGANTFLLGESELAQLVSDGGPPPETFRQSLLRAATGKKAIVAAANMSLLPADAMGGLPPFVQPFARANTVVASLDLGKELAVELELGFADGDHASDAEKAFADLRKMGKGFLQQAKGEMQKKLAATERFVPIYDGEKVGDILGPVFALAAIARGEELLADIPVTRDNNRVAVTLRVPEEMKSYASSTPILIGLLLPAVQKVREAASRTQEMNNLKQIEVARHNYYSAYKSLPIPAICDPTGKPLLSWRVAVLPFLEQEALYKRFKLDERWDSDHNKALLPLMPDVYRRPTVQPPGDSNTFFRVFVGPGALFGSYSDKVTMRQITDGTSNTLSVVAAAESVPWTKPDELKFDPNGPLPKLSSVPGGFMVAFADGSVRFIAPTIQEATLRAMITRSGGEAVPFDR